MKGRDLSPASVLTASPAGFLSRHVVFVRDGRRLGTTRQASVREKAEITLAGTTHTFQNQLVGSDFLLERSGTLLVRAEKRTLRRAFDVTLGPDGPAPRHLTLEVSGRFAFAKGGRYVLSESGRPAGEIVKAALGRSARASLPRNVPEPVQVFLVWVALMMWRRT
jgi:hypothetical protein